MKKILVFTHYFYPSKNGGGPVVSLTNFVDRLSDKYEISVVTSSIDLNEDEEYSSVKIGSWNEYNDARIMYINPNNISVGFITNILAADSYDYVYLNSLFDSRFSIFPMLARREMIKKDMNVPKYVLAPRGELNEGALSLKSNKKKLYLTISKLINLYKGITWHVTSTQEKEDVENAFRSNLDIRIAKNLTADTSNLPYLKETSNTETKRFIFLSRIHPKKNLYSALKYYSQTEGESIFHIYGQLEDKDYWNKCLELIESMPEYKRVKYMGSVDHEDVVKTFSQNDFFIFPTLGENYGHVIIESLLAGTPVILSDTTPWNMLEQKNAGWNIPLDEESKFINAIQECIYMDTSEYYEMSQNAYNFAIDTTNDKEILNKYYYIFS